MISGNMNFFSRAVTPPIGYRVKTLERFYFSFSVEDISTTFLQRAEALDLLSRPSSNAARLLFQVTFRQVYLPRALYSKVKRARREGSERGWIPEEGTTSHGRCLVYLLT